MAADLTVQVKYLSALRDRTGCRREDVSLPAGATLLDLAGWLEQRHALSLPSPDVVATLNGRGWGQLPRELSTPVQDGDTICLFPPIAGG